MKRRRHRPALIAFVVVGAVACLALGWWQWGRFESTAGSARNLGYAMQWPLFAVAFVWGYKRFVQLEDEAELAEQLAAGTVETLQQAPAAPAQPAAAMTAIPEGFLPARSAPSNPGPAAGEPADPAHDEYNRLLAELATSESMEEKK